MASFAQLLLGTANHGMLRGMFPDIDEDVLSMTLRSHGGDMRAAIDFLLAAHFEESVSVADEPAQRSAGRSPSVRAPIADGEADEGVPSGLERYGAVLREAAVPHRLGYGGTAVGARGGNAHRPDHVGGGRHSGYSQEDMEKRMADVMERQQDGDWANDRDCPAVYHLTDEAIMFHGSRFVEDGLHETDYGPVWGHWDFVEPTSSHDARQTEELHNHAAEQRLDFAVRKHGVPDAGHMNAITAHLAAADDYRFCAEVSEACGHDYFRELCEPEYPVSPPDSPAEDFPDYPASPPYSPAEDFPDYPASPPD
jgi:hypothetical protein